MLLVPVTFTENRSCLNIIYCGGAQRSSAASKITSLPESTVSVRLLSVQRVRVFCDFARETLTSEFYFFNFMVLSFRGKIDK